MFKMDLQYFGGRGSSSGGASSLPIAHPTGGAGNTDIPWSSAPNTQNPSTLREALGNKGKPMSMADAVRGANPYYDGTYREFSENCQRAVVAYEARRRGYNVTAQPTYEGDKLPQVVASNGRWQGAFKGAKSENVSGRNTQQVQNNIEAKMKEYGNGARAVVGVQWKNGGGHVFNIERQNGKTHYVDSQIGARYKPSEVLGMAKPNSVRLVRTDNLKFSDRAKKSIEQSGSRTNS